MSPGPGLRDAYVSMTCTRGRLASGSRDLRTARNTFYCYAVPFVWISSPEQQRSGASLWMVLVRSTAGGIMPVTLVNGEPVGAGVPGPLTLDLRERYWARHADPRYSVPVRYDGPGC